MDFCEKGVKAKEITYYSSALSPMTWLLDNLDMSQ